MVAVADNGCNVSDYERGERAAERHVQTGRPIEATEAVRRLAARAHARDVREFVTGYMTALRRDERMVA